MKKAKVLILILSSLLIVQVVYMLGESIRDRSLAEEIGREREKKDIKLVFEEVAPVPPEAGTGIRTHFVVNDFERRADMTGIVVVGGSIMLSDRNPISGNFSLRFDYDAVEYPRFVINYLPRDWTTFGKLSASFYNPSDDTLEMGVNVIDHITLSNPSRIYNRHFRLKPGLNKLVMDIDRMRTAINLADIMEISISVVRPEKPGTVYIDDIVLSY
jgi:hypothetical protein